MNFLPLLTGLMKVVSNFQIDISLHMPSEQRKKLNNLDTHVFFLPLLIFHLNIDFLLILVSYNSARFAFLFLFFFI